MQAITLEDKVLFEHEVLGTAYSRVPADYEGPCRLDVQGRTAQSAVFPSVTDAIAAAKFAVGELGGYLRATIAADAASKVTHQTWDEWAFSN